MRREPAPGITDLLISVLVGGLLTTSSALAQYAVIEIDTLSVKRATELAIANHPALRGARAGVESASAGYRQAFAAYLPSVSFSASDVRTEGTFAFNFPTVAVRDQKYNIYTVTISAQQTLFDFGRTIGRVSSSSDLMNASMMDEEATRYTVIMNAEIACYTLMQAAQVVNVNNEALEAAQRHLTQAKAFYSVGRRPQLDVTKAEVDLANANVNLIRARNQLQVARVQLENTIGVRLPATAILRDSFTVDSEAPALDSIRGAALENRPEIRAARARLSASAAQVTAAWTQHLPILSLTGTYGWSNYYYSPVYPRWIAGIAFTVPIFQGFAIDAQVQQARANEELAQATLDQLAQGALLEVEQNFLTLKEARERLGATIKLVEQADQALVLAERQYAAGVATVLDVTDAQLLRSNARITNIQALFDLNSSRVRLHRSMGLMP